MPRQPSKEKTLAAGKSIGQTGEEGGGGKVVGATLLVALQEVAEIHS